MGNLFFSSRAVRARRAFVMTALSALALVFSATSDAIGTTYTCTEQQQLMIQNARGTAGASCIAKPYQLVCTDDGQYGCCKAECECIFKGRVFTDKGWGGGARNFVPFSISESCAPPVKTPRAPVPGGDQLDALKRDARMTPPTPPARK